MAPLISYFTVNDTLWSLPWNNSTPLLYYNKDMFTAAGLDPETPPATWQELEADCAAIMAANAAPYCISMQIYGWYFEQWMALQGQELANNGNGRQDRATETNLTSDAAKAIMSSGRTSTTRVTGRTPASWKTTRAPTRFSTPSRPRSSLRARARCAASPPPHRMLASSLAPASSRPTATLTAPGRDHRRREPVGQRVRTPTRKIRRLPSS